MQSSRGDLGDIPSRDKADGTPASARSRRVKAREQVAGRKSRPFRQKEIAAGPSLTSREILLPIPEDDTMKATSDRMRARSCAGLSAAEPYHRPAPLSQDGFAPRDRMNGTATGTLTRPRESSTADIVSGSAPTRGPSVARLSKVPALPDSAGAAA